MSAEHAPKVPTYAECARTDKPALVTPESVSKDDERAPAIHCTNIAVAGGVKYSTWFGGSYEGSIDTKIWFSKNTDGSWTKPRGIAGNKDGEEIVYWNPVLFIPDRSRPQELHVFFKKFTPIPVWVTFWTSSDDGGETWSVPRELVPGPDGKRGRGPQKNPPIVLSNGDWLSAGSYEVTNPPGSEAYGVWDAWSDVAPKPRPGDDFKQGEKWIRSDLIELPSDRGKADGSFPGEGVIQPGIWESKGKPGHCHMTMRSSVGCIIQADSTDYGRTWGPAYRTSLPNNNSGHCVTTLRDGRVVWAGNYQTQNWGPRTPLCLAISEDDGNTWKLWATLEDAPPPDDFKRVIALETGIVNDGRSEFSYPCLTPTEEDDEDGIWVSWTWQRRGIMIARVVEF
ncbi:neuraminidase [Penicillium cosmopolitanum]|uniref:Neuraminidase n=1 Tax=Penicillium cosmopolitanum TaxID=1131564 RepID=A0A9W9VFH8_9EURO|nr:neuraminidase [Penicillium cosmopolitanum]KAJ5378894.1 neuraminidase [Penicillium cosmopolitanum]